jgi:NodT family efflux transporter outer membrane factor (OMF) lipoprotein
MKPCQLILTAVITAALFAGCNAGPDYHAPRVDLPGAYGGLPGAYGGLPGAYGGLPSTGPTTRGTAAAVDLAHWWEALNDPELNSLLDRAAKSNLDLQAAIDRLQQARAAGAVFSGAALPQMNFSGVAGVGTGTSQARGGQIDGPLDAATNASGLRQITHALGLDTFFEIDLFGNLRRAGQAVAADTAAAGEFRNQVLVTLMGDVARQYVAVRALQLRLDIAGQNAAAQRRASDLEHDLVKRGFVNELDSALADRELESTLATIDPLRARLLAAERAVAVLLGQDPESLIAELDKKSSLPIPPAAIDTGLPGDLLRRRPDVRQAEAQLVAANARLGVATANLYPKLFLSAAAGEQGQGLGRTPVDWRFIWTVGPTVDYPVLDFGLADARVQQQDQATREQLTHYRQTILTAIRQVDDALTGYDADRGRLDHLDRAVAAAQKAYDLANRRYKLGIIDYLNVLDAERELFALQDRRATGEQAAVEDFVTVCQSLGGGWQGFAPPPPLAAPLPAVLATIRDAGGNGAKPLER